MARPVALVVHELSLRYIRPVVAYIRQQLASHLESEPLYRECSDVSAADVPEGSLIFIVSHRFPRFARQRNCRYVFVNFELLRKLRWWRLISPAAQGWIRAKYRTFAANSDLYDMVLDFNPRQTRLLQRDVAARGLPVRHFMTGVASDIWRADVPLAMRTWDVCFTGTDSPRRARIRACLESRGIRVSPNIAVDMDEVIRQCRVVANVHFVACDTLEAARIVRALTAGVCLVTEPCYRLGDTIPEDCYLSVPYRHLTGTIEQLLRDPARLSRVGVTAASYMQTIYAAKAAESWRLILNEAMEL